MLFIYGFCISEKRTTPFRSEDMTLMQFSYAMLIAFSEYRETKERL